MTEPIKAIVVDPIKRAVEEVLLQTKPARPDSGAGTQVTLGEFTRVLGCNSIEGTYLGTHISLILDGEAAPDDTRDFWQYGPDCEPIPGIGIISGHNVMKDHAFDSPITLEEARAKIIFTKRIIRGTEVTERRDGDRLTIVSRRIAPIVEEREERQATTTDELSSDNEIHAFMRCGRCIDEFKEGSDPTLEGQSMATWARLSVGWTKLGLQVWCWRHQCNVINIDFEGHKHPVNVTAGERDVRPLKQGKRR